ncbi:MAG: serine/threonine protein kinase [Myxococcota bacterium]
MSPKQFGACRVVDTIASGHVTEVLRAVQQPLGRDVAIKALKPAIAPGSPFAVALEREARLLSALRHENIVRLLDYGRDEQDMWLVLEFVDGFTLRRVLDEGVELDTAAAVAIGLEMGRALAHAHERGVIHCEVRPSNVLVGKDGRIVLSDFGSAYAENMPSSPEPVDGSATLAAPSYMSPEQILGEPVDPRSDVFAMGVVLYELLSGKRPFEGRDDRTLAHSVRHDEPKPLSPTTVPRALGQIVARCLQKLPHDRFASARELCTALEGVYGTLCTTPRRRVIATALARARLIERAPQVDEERPELLGSSAQRPSILPAVRMLLAMMALLVLGGVVIHVVFRSEIAARFAAGQGPLLLKPDEAGELRVLARPWAHVLVDGEHVETTPFAKPIPLSPGVHHVTLQHPNAPDERRTIQLAAGERVVLDVTMQVKRPPKPKESGPPPAPTSSTP